MGEHMIEKLAYQMESKKSVDGVVAALEQQATANSFRVLAVHDVQETLAGKGFKRGPLKIVEVCNAGFAHEALQRSNHVALFMPCRYSVHTEGGKTIVRLARPSIMTDMLPAKGLSDLAEEVEMRLIGLMEAAV